jgi:hypothetical protein
MLVFFTAFETNQTQKPPFTRIEFPALCSLSRVRTLSSRLGATGTSEVLAKNQLSKL